MKDGNDHRLGRWVCHSVIMCVLTVHKVHIPKPSAWTKPDDSLQCSEKTNTHVGLQNQSVSFNNFDRKCEQS